MSGTTDTKGKNAVVETPPTFSEIMNKAGASAIRGGTAGAVAMGANVACLMWMRTTVSKKLITRYSLQGNLESFGRI
jgi:hypothetical protein